MTVSAIWIRDNMLGTSDQRGRQLTEAELKVQKSIEKLSVPDWYLNNRSSPPKIIRNVVPIDYRPPSWKTAGTVDGAARRKSIVGSTLPSKHSVTYTIPQNEEDSSIAKESGTNTVSTQQQQPQCSETKLRKQLNYCSGEDEQVFDTSIPTVEMSRNTSQTFPKVSPSRKIRNINIVLPPRPAVNILNSLEVDAGDGGNAESRYSTFVLNRQPRQLAREKTKEVGRNVESPSKRVERTGKRADGSIQLLIGSFATPNAKNDFKMPAASTPKFTPANLFSSTVIESTTVPSEVSTSVLDNSSILECTEANISSVSICKSSSSVLDEKKSCQRNISECFLDISSVMGSSKTSVSQCTQGTGISAIGTQEKFNEGKKKMNVFQECSIRSIDPIVFENDKNRVLSLGSEPSVSSVREIVRKIDSKNPSFPPRGTPLNHGRKERNLNDAGEKKGNLDPRTERVKMIDTGNKESNQYPSPCTRFLHSKKKSTELENIVKSKQPLRGKGHVQEIIEELKEKCRFSTITKKTHPLAGTSNQNLVKTIVTALENGGDTLASRKMRRRVEGGCTGGRRRNSTDDEDPESCNESELKTAASSTTISLKDTDSSSDYEQRSPCFKSDEESRFDYDTVTGEETSPEARGKINRHDEEDSVYWIPVSSRCILPRTSSLLSIISKLSRAQSPCVSPIRSESETSEMDNCPNEAWGATFNKKKSAITSAMKPKKLFRIDETVVVDSGYSDKSERCSNVSGSSTVNSTCSDDDQNDFESEARSSRVKKSRRKVNLGQRRASLCNIDS